MKSQQEVRKNCNAIVSFLMKNEGISKFGLGNFNLWEEKCNVSQIRFSKNILKCNNLGKTFSLSNFIEWSNFKMKGGHFSTGPEGPWKLKCKGWKEFQILIIETLSVIGSIRIKCESPVFRLKQRRLEIGNGRIVD